MWMGVDPDTVTRLVDRSVAQPWRTATTPLRLTGAWEKVPRLGVLSSFTIEQVEAMAGTAPLFRHMAGDGWQFAELPTWHWPMLSRPTELAEILSINSGPFRREARRAGRPCRRRAASSAR